MYESINLGIDKIYYRWVTPIQQYKAYCLDLTHYWCLEVGGCKK